MEAVRGPAGAQERVTTPGWCMGWPEEASQGSPLGGVEVCGLVGPVGLEDSELRAEWMWAGGR